jgi:integrase
VWWIAYYAPKNGRSVEHREPALLADRDGEAPRPAKTEGEARRLLKLRLREVAVHKAGLRPFQGPRQEKVSFEDLLRSVERDYEIRGLKSVRQLKSHLAHVRAYFGDDRALGVTTERLRDFVAHRQKAGSKPASIKRQLEAIRRAFTLATEAGTVTYAPAIPSLTVQNARQGFLSRADFEALLGSMTDADVRDFADWGFWTGMRKGEIASLTWDTLDRDGNRWTLRLHAKDAKTGHGRALALEGPVRAVVERRLAARRLDCPFIFHRAGEPIGEFRKAWATALRRAGLRGLRFHDLRRSAVRNMVRAGVDPAIAMKVSGHRTRAVFDRYNIVSEDDLRDAVLKTASYVSTLPTERTVAVLPAGTDKAV